MVLGLLVVGLIPRASNVGANRRNPEGKGATVADKDPAWTESDLPLCAVLGNIDSLDLWSRDGREGVWAW